ncbi:MAG: hypothetical protein M3O31_12265 [Acidobacteriota bacterium]|nr:hypothetical protein [Acidobacteriota bacterium]
MLPSLLAAVSLMLSGVTVLEAQTEKLTYGQHLLEEASAKHPGISGLEVRLPKLDQSGAQILSWGKTGKRSLDLTLQDVTSTAAGEIKVTFPRSTGLTAAQQRAEAESIRNDLRGRTLDSFNLFDPFPYDPHFSQNTYGQHVVDETLSAHHDILVLGLHAKPTDGAASVILASNFGRIGKPDDAGDLKIVETEQPESLVTKAGNRCNFGLPLHDNLGLTIGLITVAYAYADGDDKAALMARAVNLRDEVSRRLLNKGSLTENYPLDPTLVGRYYAQLLVEEVLLMHPRVAGVALHVTPPGRTDNLILASTFGRVGQLSDESDLQMIRSGKHNVHVLPSGMRYSGELTLRDSARRTIGALLIIFPYKPGDDTDSLLKEAKQIRQELAARIQNVAELMRR